MTGRIRDRPHADILTIGDELLKGSTLNTNAQFLGRELTGIGFRVMGQTACPDRVDTIREALGHALERSDLVVVTGGLGPTPDDVTRESIAGFFRVPLKFSSAQHQRILSYFRVHKKKVPPCVRKEAEFPANAVPLINRHGVALGFYVEAGGRLIIVLPGVPGEQRKMFSELAVPLLRERFSGLKKRQCLIVRTVGIFEADIIARLGKRFFRDDFDFGIYPSPGETAIRIYTEKAARLREMRRHIERKLGSRIYSWEDKELVQVVADLIVKKRRTLAVAESCSGGGLAARITGVPGSSRYFRGGIVAYSNDVKKSLLDVPASVLSRQGAVSSPVAAQMARGVRQKFGSDVGVGITGIAGPAGGTRTKPVGTVYIALSSKQRTQSWHYEFPGRREQMQQKCIQKALEHLWQWQK